MGAIYALFYRRDGHSCGVYKVKGGTRFLPPVKKKLKRALGQQGLEKEAELWGLCPHPSPPVPITYIANWTLGARGHQEM